MLILQITQPLWSTLWSQCHVDLAEYTTSVEYILEKGGSINLYMFHGGTNFGFTNGANSGPFLPTVTSYGQ